MNTYNEFRNYSIEKAIDLMIEYYNDIKLLVPDTDDDKLVNAVEKTFDKHFVVF